MRGEATSPWTGGVAGRAGNGVAGAPAGEVVARGWRGVVALVFPALCPGCGRPAEPVCAACRGRLRPPPTLAPPPGVDAWAAAFAYEGVARELVARVKYRGRRAASPWLAECMVHAWHAAGGDRVGVDLVTWVPTAPERRRARGFDHARDLGVLVARRLRLPAAALLRRAPGPAQTDLSRAARRRGPVVSARRAVGGSVLVVDDVATTGATLRVCAAALRAAGADRVVALTAARTSPRRIRGPPGRLATLPYAPGRCPRDGHGGCPRRWAPRSTSRGPGCGGGSRPVPGSGTGTTPPATRPSPRARWGRSTSGRARGHRGWRWRSR